VKRVDQRSADEPEEVAGLVAEAERLQWLAGRAGAPEVVSFEHDGVRATLATATMGGSPASDPIHRIDAVALASAFGEALRHVHDLDASGCPFDAGLARRRDEIERRSATGRLSSVAFSEPYERHGAERLVALWREAQSGLPAEDLVVVHGEFALENVWLADSRIVGVGGWERCGVADRYVDVAVAARSLAGAVGPEPLAAFLDAYGLEHPSLAKIDFYALTAELLS
jgi:kanamycin kinase/aminoglycoside 3'-phosphotransferase-2